MLGVLDASHQHDHTSCPVYAADKKEYFKLHRDRVTNKKRIENPKDRPNCQDGGHGGKDQHVRQIGQVAESLLQAGQQLQELQEQLLQHGHPGP